MRNNESPQVEVIIVDDPWAEFGMRLPEAGSVNVAATEDRSRYSGARRWPVWSAAALFTALIHSLFIGSLLLGSSVRKHQLPMTDGMAANLHNDTTTEFVSTLIFINDSQSMAAETPEDSAYAVQHPSRDNAKRLEELVQMASVSQPEITGSEEGTESSTTTVDAQTAEGRALLFGRYMGQIKARIERAWSYPTHSVRTSFRCTAQIKQTKQGDVQEVTLVHCDGDPKWQLSLAKAIQAASPLSAPPDDTVFTQIVTLNFDAAIPVATQASAQNK